MATSPLGSHQRRLLLLFFALFCANEAVLSHPYGSVENGPAKIPDSECFQKLFAAYSETDILNLLKKELGENEVLKEGWNEKHYNKLLKRKALGDFASMKKEYVIALISYTGPVLYSKFNSETYQLLKDDLQTGWQAYPYKAMFLLLFKAYETGNRFGCGSYSIGRVFRGMQRFYNVEKEKNKDGIVTMKTFTSTSRDKKIAVQYMGNSKEKTLMRIDLPKTGLYMCIENISAKPKEQEVLIPPFRKFKVKEELKEGKLLELGLQDVGEYCEGYEPVSKLY